MPYNCAEQCPSYGENTCDEDLIAEISEVAIIDPASGITGTSTSQEWIDAIFAGLVTLTGAMLVDIPDASPVLIDNPRGCRGGQKLIRNDLSVTGTDPNVSALNDAFYGCMNGATKDFAYFYCNSNQIRIFTNGVLIARPAQSVGAGTDVQKYNFTHNFRLNKSDFGELVDAPAGIFGQL